MYARVRKHKQCVHTPSTSPNPEVHLYIPDRTTLTVSNSATTHSHSRLVHGSQPVSAGTHPSGFCVRAVGIRIRLRNSPADEWHPRVRMPTDKTCRKRPFSVENGRFLTGTCRYLRIRTRRYGYFAFETRIRIRARNTCQVCEPADTDFPTSVPAGYRLPAGIPVYPCTSLR